jgi:hypothetical protein
VLTAPEHECEEFDVYYSEWGELGLTLRDQQSSHLVVRVSEKSAALGAKVGSILLTVNGESVIELPHTEMLQKVADAEWPKTLRFKIHKVTIFHLLATASTLSAQLCILTCALLCLSTLGI